MNKDVILTIVIPAYNEEKSIGGTLREISEYLVKRDISGEIVVVDDGSVDNTLDNAQDSAVFFSNFKMLKNDINRGKGYSVRRGVLAAEGRYTLFMDADNSTSIYEFDRFLPLLEEGCDAVIASRRLKDSVVEKEQPLIRAKMGRFYIFLSRMIMGLKFSDFNCGFKAYNTKAVRNIFELQRMDDWSFDIELLFLMNKYGLKIREVPVRWVHKDASKVKPFRDAVRSFISMLNIRLNDIRRMYNKYPG